MITHIDTDNNGNYWFEIDGETYGITPEGRGMDNEGRPLDSVLSLKNEGIQAQLEEAANELKKD